jgi:outer membrane protein OmpA-like peptidoglycan-associated protein
MINFQKKFGEREYFGLYLSLGAKFQLPFSAKYSIVDGINENHDKIMISGDYAEDNLKELGYFGKELPQHGFDHIHNPSEVLTVTDDGKLNLKWNISAVGEAGILISLSRRVDIALGAFIDYGLMDINKKKTTDETSQLFAFTGSDYVAGAENNVGNGIVYNSLLNAYYGANKYVDKVSTFSYGGKIGLRIKLGKLSQKQQPQVGFTPCDKDTVYIYKTEPAQPVEQQQQQPYYPPIDSILKEVMDALKEMPRYDTPPVINNYNNYGKPDDDYDSYLPDYIPKEEVDILFLPIYFDLDKAILRPESIVDLDKKVAILKKYPEIKLVIFGNTCDLGTDPHNYK